MQPEDIRLLFYLPNLQSYQDRTHLIGQIARRVGKVILVTSNRDIGPDEIGINSQLEVIQIPRGARIPGRTTLAASRVAAGVLSKYRINIVHDTFGHLLPLFFHRQRFPRCVFVTSQYNLAEWDFRHFFWPRYHMHYFLKYSDLRLWLLRILIQRIIFCLADCIVVQAPGLIDRLVQHVDVPRTKVCWLPNSIAGPSKCRQANTISRRSDPTIRLLFVGGFAVLKGADTLLNLLDLARMRNILLHATVVGGLAATDEHYLRRRICSLDLGERLVIHGRVERDSVNSFYDCSDWLFHLSAVDGSPRVVLESLSRGLPVIGSSHPGITVLDPNRRFILFTDSSKLGPLLDELVASKNDCQRYSARSALGQSYVRTHFSNDAVSERYAELYMHLVQRRSWARS